MRVTGIMYPPNGSRDLMGFRHAMYWDVCVDGIAHFFNGGRNPGGWFYAYMPGYAGMCDRVLEQAKEQSLSEEEQLWIAALEAFRDYARNLAENRPADRQDIRIIRAFAAHMERLLLGPLKRPAHGTPADWEALPGVSWKQWNEAHDVQRVLVEASHEIQVQGPTGIWRPYGLVEGEEWPPACRKDEAGGATDDSGPAEA